MKIKVLVHPNSKKPRIVKDLTETLHFYVSEPPLEGKANLAVINQLSEYYGVSKAHIKLLFGEKSKIKYFEIQEKLK